MSKYPRFTEALRGLAPTNQKRAARLGVSLRSLYYYLSGDALPRTQKLKEFPKLDRALTRDLRSRSEEQVPD